MSVKASVEKVLAGAHAGAGYATVNITVDGAPMEVHRYHVVYVAKPLEVSARRARARRFMEACTWDGLSNRSEAS